MNITILGNHDLHTNRSLNLLRNTLKKHTVSIFLSERMKMPHKDYVPPRELLNLRFLEHDLLCKLFDDALTHLPRNELRYFSFSELATFFQTDIRYDRDVNASPVYEEYEATQPDIVISIRYLSILKQRAIQVPKHGVINLHSGLLPKYRGILSTLRALVAGETEVGCTLHYINDPKIDAGPIIGTRSIKVDRNRSLLWHVFELYEPGCEMIGEVIDAIDRGEQVQSAPQVTGIYEKTAPTEEDFINLAKAGFRVWDRDDVLPVFARYVG